MKTIRRGLFLLLAATIWLAVAGTVLAQTNRLQLSLNKLSGIGLGGQIQGLFQLSVSGASDVSSVTYLLDGKEMGTANQAPFAFQFHTDSYAPGKHQFTATARTASGQLLTSNTVDAEIVSFSEGWSSVVRLLWPILVVLVLVLGVGIAVPLLSTRSARHYEPGAARNYGIVGGTVCTRCGRPYALSIFGMRLVVGRLARCPYCGKWSLARPASQAALRAAEQSEIASQPSVPEPSPEDLLRKQIEDSRMSR